MKRNEFLAALGISSTAVILTTYLGCSKNSGGGGMAPSNFPSNIDFTPELTSSANAALLTNRGYLAINGIYQASNYQFYSNNHGATFSEVGIVTIGTCKPFPHNI